MKAFTRAPVYMGQFANGDDTDETDAITRAFAAAAGKTLEFEPGKTYRVSSEITPGEGTTVKQNGATLNLGSAGGQRCIVVPTGLNWIGGGGTVKNIGTGSIGHGGNQCPFVIGDYLTGAGYHAISIQDVVIENTMLGTNGIMITGGSYDVHLTNLSFPDSATLTIPILAHWGGADVLVGGATPSGSTHPHNIRIANISVGNLTRDTGGGACVTLSAVYDVIVENVAAGNIQCEHGIVFTFAGDNGGYYAGEYIKQLVMTGIHIRNASALSTKKGGLIQCRSTLDPEKAIYPGPTYENYKIVNVDSAKTGLIVGNCLGARIVNPRIAGALVGISTAENADRVQILGGEIKDCQTYGVNLSNTPLPTNPEVSRTKISNCGVGGGASAQIRVNADNATIRNCVLGLSSGESATYGVRVEATAVGCEIIGNHCNGTAGGAAFSIGGKTNYGTIKACKENSAASGLVLYDGMTPLVHSTIGVGSKKIRQMIGYMVPDTGTWNSGDMLDFVLPYEGGFTSARCTVPGTPGTWMGLGANDQPTITNQFQHTEDLSNPVWNKSRCTVTINSVADPGGNATVDRLDCDATSGSGMSVNQTGLTVVSGLAYTISAYIEKGYDDWALIVAYDGTLAAVRQWFNVANGTLGSSNTAGDGWVKAGANIAPWGNGYRCELAFICNGTTLMGNIYPSVSANEDYDCISGTTYGYVWGSQLDRGVKALTYRPRTT